MLRNPDDVEDSDIEAVMEGEDTMSRVSGKVGKITVVFLLMLKN